MEENKPPEKNISGKLVMLLLSLLFALTASALWLLWHSSPYAIK